MKRKLLLILLLDAIVFLTVAIWLGRQEAHEESYRSQLRRDGLPAERE